MENASTEYFKNQELAERVVIKSEGRASAPPLRYWEMGLRVGLVPGNSSSAFPLETDVGGQHGSGEDHGGYGTQKKQ